MSEILSQNEIDNLLKELNSGIVDIDNLTNESNKKQVKKYDFKRPNKFSKDHIRTLHTIHDKYGKLISGVLTKYLRTAFQMDLESIEALSYRDFNNSIANPSVLSIIEMAPLKGTMVCEISPAISYAIIDRVLGGSGVSNEKVKEFTKIEISILHKAILKIVEMLPEAWANIISLDPSLERIETNPQLAQITSLDEMVLLATFKAKIDSTEDLMNICIPYLLIEPIISKLNTKFWFSSNKREDGVVNSRASIEENLLGTNIPIKTVLGGTVLSFNDVVNLQEGDVIPLDSYINSSLKILVDNVLKFKGTPGVCNRKYSIKITDIVEGGEQV